MDDINNDLERVGSTETTILLGDFNEHLGTEKWKGVIGGRGDSVFNEIGGYLL